MYSFKDFYDSYQTNYFDYKQSCNEFILDKTTSDLKNIADGIIDYNEKSFRRAIKMDVRLTYLLAVDALFELVFALLPDKNRALMDKKILDQLSRKNQYYPDLKKYLTNKPNQFDKLNYTINYTRDKSCSVLRYIFYDGLFETEYEKEIIESVDAIEAAILFLGKEVMENREELNSFKHGLRVTPFFNRMVLSDPKTKNQELNIDMVDSLTFQTKTNGIRTLHAKPLDYKKDIALTLYISNMIHNIIVLRRRKFKSPSKEGMTEVIAFKKTALDKARKANMQMGNFKLNLPIV